MVIILYIIAGGLLIVSAIAHVYVRIRFRPRDSELDDDYYEFEDEHPEVARYNKWTKITFTSITIAVLLLFLAVVI